MWKMKTLLVLSLSMFLGTYSSTKPMMGQNNRFMDNKVISKPITKSVQEISEKNFDSLEQKITQKIVTIKAISDTVKRQQKLIKY